MTQRQRDDADAPIAERDSDQPPQAVQNELKALPFVARFRDGGIKQRVINYLYHLQMTPHLYHAFLLLLGGEAPGRSPFFRFLPRTRNASTFRFHQIENVWQQLKILKTWAALPSAEHAEALLDLVAAYRDAALSTDALRELAINIGCKLGAWETISEGHGSRKDFIDNYRDRQLRRLEGLTRLLRYERVEELSVADREKLLWIFENCSTRGYAPLRALFSMGGNRLGGPAPDFSSLRETRLLESPDFTSSENNRLIDHLHELATSTAIDPEFLPDRVRGRELPGRGANATAKELSKATLVASLIAECATPDATVNQGTAGTCGITSVLNRLANIRPAEYARIAKELILRRSITFEWNANARSRWYDTHYRNDHSLPDGLLNRWNGYGRAPTTIVTPAGWNRGANRSITERVLQQAFVQHINTANHVVDAAGALDDGIHTVDAAILAVNLLGAERGFELAHARDDRDPNPGASLRCMWQQPIDDWLRYIREALAKGTPVVFVDFLWRPVVAVFQTADPRCVDPFQDLEVRRTSSYHLVQVRSIETRTRPDGTSEERIFFWNPWGAEDVLDGGGTTNAAAGEITAQVEASIGPGMMSTTREEFIRHCRGYMFMDPPP